MGKSRKWKTCTIFIISAWATAAAAASLGGGWRGHHCAIGEILLINNPSPKSSSGKLSRWKVFQLPERKRTARERLKNFKDEKVTKKRRKTDKRDEFDLREWKKIEFSSFQTSIQFLKFLFLFSSVLILLISFFLHLEGFERSSVSSAAVKRKIEQFQNEIAFLTGFRELFLHENSKLLSASQY